MSMIILKSIGRKMNNLYFSEKDLLFNKIKDHISSANQEILIMVPFIQTKCLEQILQNCSCKITIITTWKLKDLQLGISELDLYNYCKRNDIFLYINNRVHLKAIISDYSSCLFGSANISSKGLALASNYNYELCAKIEELNIDSIIYFKHILHESILVNDNIYNLYNEKFEELEFLDDYEELNLIDVDSKSEFLISELPMSYGIDELFQVYSNGFKTINSEKRDCAIHDIVLYQIPLNLGYEDFKEILNKGFESPFILKLLAFIDEKPCYFGQVKEWVHNNCTDVPVPAEEI